LEPIKRVLNNKMLKESAWALMSKGSAFFAFYALQIFLIRSLTVTNWGLWSFFFSVLSLVLLISDFGINLSSKKFIAQYEDSLKLPAILRQSLFLRLGFSFTFALLILLFYKPLLIAINREELAPFFFYVPWVVFFYSLLDFFKAYCEGVHRLRFYFTLNCIEHWGKLTILIVLFENYKKIEVLVLGLALTYLVGSASGFLMFRKRFFPAAVDKEPFHAWLQVLKYSVPLFVMLFVALGAMEVDTIMLNYLKGNYETGIYATAKQIVFYIPHITLAITMGTMPVFARMKVEQRESYHHKFTKIQNINNKILLAILIIIACSGWYLVPLIYGEEYSLSVMPLVCLLPYAFFVSHGLCSGALLDYRGKAGRRAFNLSVTMVANIGLNFLLIPVWGATGSAIATSLAYLPYFLLNHRAAHREFST
jgi:O-antigen/teichoic acid export membrane protein